MRDLIGRYAFKALFEGLSRGGALLPKARAMRARLTVHRNVAYGPLDPWNLLDVWRSDAETRPALLYLHGGSFRILSKDTHWLMASVFARAGFVVFNANYRLAPKAPFPAALEDAARAYRFVVEHGARFGADPQRLVLAGESAGANLTLALALCATFARPEPFAREVFATGVVPKAIAPMCGVLQVSDIARFSRRKPGMRSVVADRLHELERAYLGAERGALADPLTLLESDAQPARPLPAVYSAVGTKDPLLDDTRRLAAALQKRGVPHQIDFFPKELHAFHALSWREAAQRCWRDQLAFLRAHAVDSPRFGASA